MMADVRSKTIESLPRQTIRGRTLLCAVLVAAILAAAATLLLRRLPSDYRWLSLTFLAGAGFGMCIMVAVVCFHRWVLAPPAEQLDFSFSQRSWTRWRTVALMLIGSGLLLALTRGNFHQYEVRDFSFSQCQLWLFLLGFPLGLQVFGLVQLFTPVQLRSDGVLAGVHYAAWTDIRDVSYLPTWRGTIDCILHRRSGGFVGFAIPAHRRSEVQRYLNQRLREFTPPPENHGLWEELN